jgi:hypothetical protein
MIMISDEPSTLKLVQVVGNIGLIAAGEELDRLMVFDVAQWDSTEEGYFCELQSDPANTPCDSGSVCWGTSDAYGPLFCTKHFFDGSTGFEFVALGAKAGER